MRGDIGLEGESRNNVTLGHLCHHLLVRTRSSHWKCYVRKGVLRNFAKFTGKHQCQSLFFNKVAGFGTGGFLLILRNF